MRNTGRCPKCGGTDLLTPDPGLCNSFPVSFFCQRQDPALRLPRLRLYGGVDRGGVHGKAAAVLLAERKIMKAGVYPA